MNPKRRSLWNFQRKNIGFSFRKQKRQLKCNFKICLFSFFFFPSYSNVLRHLENKNISLKQVWLISISIFSLLLSRYFNYIKWSCYFLIINYSQVTLSPVINEGNRKFYKNHSSTVLWIIDIISPHTLQFWFFFF